MKIKIDIGARGTLKKFKKSYQRDFLEKYGYKAYGGNFVFLAETVETKYGELVVHDNDVVTYVGNKLWSVL